MAGPIAGRKLDRRCDRRDRRIADHLDPAAHRDHLRIAHALVAELIQARLAMHERGRDGVLHAHLRFAAGRNIGPIGAVAEQRMAAHDHPLDRLGRVAAPPIEHAIEDGMDHEAAWIWLVGGRHQLPGVAEARCHARQIGRIAHRIVKSLLACERLGVPLGHPFDETDFVQARRQCQ